MNHEDYVINKRTKYFKKLSKKFKNLLIYDHHLSHASSACFSQDLKIAIV